MDHGRLRWLLTSPIRLAAVAVVSLTACRGAGEGPRSSKEKPDAGPGPASFSERIAPLAEQRCDGCHAQAPGGSMGVYRTARSLVTPGKPAESPYYTLPKGHPPAWGDSADLVREWIASGAHE
jgi:hypothetical protein